MATLYTERESNIRRTWGLFTVFFFVVIGLGWFFGQVYDNQAIVVIASLFSIVSAIVSYWYSDSIALSFAGARQIQKKDMPEYWNIVENLTMSAGLPMPRLYITEEPQINAFATGRNPEHSAIAVTRGALERLTKVELEGVLAHELSHIGNRDILVSTVAVVLAGIISMMSDMFMRAMWFGGMRRRDDGERGGALQILALVLVVLAPIGAALMQFALSRRREFLADASGALLTRYPEGLAMALEKISRDVMPMGAARSSTAHMWIANPFRGEGTPWYTKLFMTHPPVEERIKALRQMG